MSCFQHGGTSSFVKNLQLFNELFMIPGECTKFSDITKPVLSQTIYQIPVG